MKPAAATERPHFSGRILDNGLRVLCHADPSAPVVAVNVIYRVGSRYEEPGKTGYAHLFEHLMFDGSRHIGRGEYDRHCTLAGGENNAWTSCDLTNYWITLPAHRLELGLWLESDRMSGFAVEEISLETQKGVVAAEKRQTIDNVPYGNSWIAVRELMFAPGHPYRHEPIGLMEDVAAASLADMRSFYERFYIPRNATLVIAGGIGEKEGLDLAEEYFGGIPGGEVPAVSPLSPSLLITGQEQEIIDPITPLNAVFMGWHVPDLHSFDLRALELLAGILADGESSRFYLGLEYDPMIASETAAFIDEGEIGSTFCVYAIAQNNRIRPARLERGLLEQIEKMAATGPTGQELQKAKNRKISAVVHGLQSVTNRAERMAYFAAVCDDPSLTWHEAQTYEEITVRDIRNAAERYLASARPSIVRYGAAASSNS